VIWGFSLLIRAVDLSPLSLVKFDMELTFQTFNSLLLGPSLGLDISEKILISISGLMVKCSISQVPGNISQR
jgi:hypothetical protein